MVIRPRFATKNPFNQLQNLFESTAAKLADSLLGMQSGSDVPPGMRRVRTQFIAALGDPRATSADEGAEQWGIWRVDPGPRGVFISQYQSQLAGRNNRAPAGWILDPKNFWIEEYGRIMEEPDFPVPPGRYLVTGAREVTAVLTVGEPRPGDGAQSWRLDGGATLHDVTHLPCRSARYTTATTTDATTAPSPGDADPADFPVRPGGPMPPIPGCQKQDYAVLFVLAVEDDS
jgi:hypothetical protein